MAASPQHVGVVGLGRMGSAMARRLGDEGWTVHGYDVRPERLELDLGPAFVPAESAAAVAEQARCVLLSVFDDDQLVEAVRGERGILQGARPGSVIVDTSTVSPAASERVGSECTAGGASLLRATVSGNPGVAGQGTLGMFCSGPRAAYDAVGEVLDCLASDHRWLGNAEQARYAKLGVNMIVIGTMVLVSEALAVAERAGMDRAAFLDVVSGSVIASRFTDYKSELLIQNDFAPTMTSGDVRKDLKIALATAQQLGVAVPTTAIVDQAYASVEERGLGHLDFAAVVLTHATQAGET